MSAPASGAGADRRGDRIATRSDLSRTAFAPQAVPPLERHVIPDDKIALFEVAPVRRLVGTWQGPGTIREMRSRT